ncbi:MAG: hypothetical protein KR126chlam1_00175 [Chlamydiae bacterium]|nr:hypothetical protein [Chlamydiota bacterium]
MYVDLANIHIDETGIYVTFYDEEWIQVTELHKDEKGFSVVMNKDKWASILWKCPGCGFENKFWKRTCENCGYRPRH